MARTNRKHVRAYIDQYDMSGDARSVGAPVWEYDTDPGASFADAINNIAGMGAANVNVEQINSFFDNATGHIHTLNAANATRIVSIPVGANAAPAAGSPVFCAALKQTGYMSEGEGTVACNVKFGGLSSEAATRGLYSIPWGNVLHAKAAATAANSGAASHTFGGDTTKGGYGVLHIFATNGTCTFSIEKNDGGWAELLAFATTGDAVGSEIKTLAIGDTVKSELRWQIALGTATSVTFFMAFVRGTGV